MLFTFSAPLDILAKVKNNGVGRAGYAEKKEQGFHFSSEFRLHSLRDGSFGPREGGRETHPLGSGGGRRGVDRDAATGGGSGGLSRATRTEVRTHG